MVITNRALNTSSARRLGKALQTRSNHGQDREKGLIEHHRLRDGKKKDTVHCLEFPCLGFYSFLPQKLSYIPHLSAYFTYLGKVSSLSWLQSISENHVANMFQEKPALCLLDFFLLLGGGGIQIFFTPSVSHHDLDR